MEDREAAALCGGQWSEIKRSGLLLWAVKQRGEIKMENLKDWQIKPMLEKLGNLRELMEDYVLEMRELRKENNWIRENYRTLKHSLPQPCRKFKDAATTELLAKLAEETSEVVQEALSLESLRKADALQTEEAEETTAHLAEELTDLITFCTTWLDALGYDASERRKVQNVINAKNKGRGYW